MENMDSIQKEIDQLMEMANNLENLIIDYVYYDNQAESVQVYFSELNADDELVKDIILVFTGNVTYNYEETTNPIDKGLLFVENEQFVWTNSNDKENYQQDFFFKSDYVDWTVEFNDDFEQAN